MGNYHFLFAFGSTPTRVGNITHLMPESPAAKAFPPPTWGIPLVFVFNNLLSGLPPPAWGTLLTTATRRKNAQEYPHPRGEYCNFSLFSSFARRITPTRVGKKEALRPRYSEGLAYPHSRGVKCKLFRPQAIPRGIPPYT